MATIKSIHNDLFPFKDNLWKTGHGFHMNIAYIFLMSFFFHASFASFFFFSGSWNLFFCCCFFSRGWKATLPWTGNKNLLSLHKGKLQLHVRCLVPYQLAIIGNDCKFMHYIRMYSVEPPLWVYSLTVTHFLKTKSYENGCLYSKDLVWEGTQCSMPGQGINSCIFSTYELGRTHCIMLW